MKLAGGAVIAAVALLLTGLSALPGSIAGTSSALEPADLGGDDGGCIAATKNLLCHATTQPNDPLIAVEGPGTLAAVDPRLMIDGNVVTRWRSVGDVTGAVVTLTFAQPVRVGTVGFAWDPASGVPRGTVPSDVGAVAERVTWSFRGPDDSTGSCAANSSEAFGDPVGQQTASALLSITPRDTCEVKLRIDRISAPGAAAQPGSVAIGDLILRSA